jgi:fucose 4-O-acetylase-like acetyltransferase
MNNNRLISFLQIFGIILVVFGHSISRDDAESLFNWIYSFHMPLFMLISGYLFVYAPHNKGIALKNINLLGKKGFVLKKIKRLIVPYFIISSITFIPKVYLSQFALRPTAFSFKEWINMLIYPKENVIIYFWFLPTLFIIMLIVISYIKLANRLNIKIPLYANIIICILLHFFNPIHNIGLLNISGVIHYLLYFVLGIVFYLKQPIIEKIIKTNLLLISMLSFLFSIFLSYYSSLAVINALCGIVFSVSLAFIYTTNNFKFLDYLNGSSFTIYLFSWYPQSFIRVLFDHYNWSYILLMIFSIILGIYMPFVIYKFLMYIKLRYKYGNTIAMLLGC